MQEPLITIQGDKLVIEQSQLMLYAVIAAAVIVLLVVLTVALKSRKKGFIKTIPSNLKEQK